MMGAATPAQVVAAARGYLGVRWHHQGRSRAGLDCIGLVVRVAHDLGLSEFDVAGYGRNPDSDRLRAGLREHCVERFGSPEVGMVALMRFDIAPQHLAFVVPYEHGGLGLVHALVTARRVVEHRLDVVNLARIGGLFDLPGVAR